MKQSTKVLLGFVFGVIFGLLGYYYLPQKDFAFMKWFTDACTLFGALFLRTIFMIVVPLLVSALMLGVFELGKGRGLGKVAKKSLAYTLFLSLMAVFIAVILTNLLQPGAGLVFDKDALKANQGVLSISQNLEKAASIPWYQYIINLIPNNPIDSAARAFQGEIIALMIFALMFGYALSIYTQDEDHPFIKTLDAIFNTCIVICGWAMKIAPYGIFGIVFNTTYRMGAGFLANVAYFAFVVIFGLALQQFVVYGLALKFIGKVNPWEYMKKCREVYIYAFSTASSNVTLPVALDCAERVLHLPPKIARFVLTCGASANQNGTALFEGVVVLFLAQVYGLNLNIEQQFVVVLMAVLAGVGTAGVPGGSLPLIAILCVQVGVPVEGMGLILGVDRFLDMCRTTLNVSGDLIIARLVSSNVDESDIPE